MDNQRKYSNDMKIAVALVLLLFSVAILIFIRYIFNKKSESGESMPNSVESTGNSEELMPNTKPPKKTFSSMDEIFESLKSDDKNGFLADHRKGIENDLIKLHKNKNKDLDRKYDIIRFNLALVEFFLYDGEHLQLHKKAEHYRTYSRDLQEPMESDHNFIQYLFPNLGSSQFETEKTMLLTTGKFLKKHVNTVGPIIEDFVDTFAQFLINKNKDWFSKDDHNKRRISRLIRTCKLFGLENKLTEFQNRLKKDLKYDLLKEKSKAVKKAYFSALNARELNVNN